MLIVRETNEITQVMANGYDNMNVMVHRLGPEDKEKGQYIAVTDFPTVAEIDIDTLAFKKTLALNPIFDGISAASCAHWRKEVGKNTYINYQIIIHPITGKQEFRLYRFGDNFDVSSSVLGVFGRLSTRPL